MSGLSYLAFYVPLCLVVLTVLEMCRDSRPSRVLKRVGRNFLMLTGLFIGGSALIFLLQILL